ncbi:MAG TPA: putative maltokinase [Chthoniobacteraceae bacterium]|jgi:trehalose synthase-fused probable maltokinase
MSHSTSSGSLQPPSYEEALSAALGEQGPAREKFEQEILPTYVQRCRWFGGKARSPRIFRIQDALPLGESWIVFLKVEYADASAETYQLLLETGAGEIARQIQSESPEAVIAVSSTGGTIIFDALYGDSARDALRRLMTSSGKLPGRRGELLGISGAVLTEAGEVSSRLLKVEQSNSSIIYGDRVFLKLYRKLEAGINPDAEITRFLTERQHFPHVPPFAGALEYRPEDGAAQVLGLALGLVQNEGDAWTWALSEVAAYYERVLQVSQPAPTPAGLFDEQSLSTETAAVVGEEFLRRAEQLGTRTGELHLALAGDSTDPAFAPEDFAATDQQELEQAIRASTQSLFAALANRSADPLIASLLEGASAIEDRLAQLSAGPLQAAKIRTHGDYHLGQVLNTGADFVIIDFEGEPLRPLAERRLKRSPLRDVAGMLRSFHYAAHAGLVTRADRGALEPRAEVWSEAASRAFLRGWSEATRGAIFVPHSAGDVIRLLEAFLLEKAIYEVGYEFNNRPDWLPIPARGVLRLLHGSSAK